MSEHKGRRNKRPNPAVGLPGLDKMLARSAGSLLIQDALKDATLEETMVLAAMMPMMLKFIRMGGKGAAGSVLDTIYPDGVTFDLAGMGELTRPPGTANAKSGAEPGAPEVKE